MGLSNGDAINTNKARNTIKDVAKECHKAVMMITQTNEELLRSLRDNWFSPEAVNFRSLYVPRIESMIVDFEQKARMIIGCCEIVFNRYLDVNGINEPRLEGEEDLFLRNRFYGNGLSEEFKIANNDGDSGMDVINIRDNVLPLYIRRQVDISEQLYMIPTKIAIYDPEQSINQEFAALMNNFSANVRSIYNEIVNQIVEYAKVQLRKVENGAIEAADLINVITNNANNINSVGWNFL